MKNNVFLILFPVCGFLFPVVLRLFFAPPGAAYIAYLPLTYIVWGVGFFALVFVYSKKILSERYHIVPFGLFIIICSLFSIDFYSKSGDKSDPFAQSAALFDAIFHYDTITLDDKYAYAKNDAQRIKRIAAEIKYRDHSPERAFFIRFAKSGSGWIGDHYIVKSDGDYITDMTDFSLTNPDSISFSLTGVSYMLSLSDLEDRSNYDLKLSDDISINFYSSDLKPETGIENIVVDILSVLYTY